MLPKNVDNNHLNTNNNHMTDFPDMFSKRMSLCAYNNCNASNNRSHLCSYPTWTENIGNGQIKNATPNPTCSPTSGARNNNARPRASGKARNGRYVLPKTNMHDQIRIETFMNDSHGTSLHDNSNTTKITIITIQHVAGECARSNPFDCGMVIIIVVTYQRHKKLK